MVKTWSYVVAGCPITAQIFGRSIFIAETMSFHKCGADTFFRFTSIFCENGFMWLSVANAKTLKNCRLQSCYWRPVATPMFLYTAATKMSSVLKLMAKHRRFEMFHSVGHVLVLSNRNDSVGFTGAMMACAMSRVASWGSREKRLVSEPFETLNAP